ncbi:MAG: Nucleotide sugar dehydrogenase, partial [Candidatus Moranbacteria bacterium GW2011_GWF1_44_4]
WGLAFKPDTDDTREAPAVDVIKWLLEEGAHVNVYDPVASVKKIFGSEIKHCRDMYEAAEDSEVLLVVTEWDEFKKADLKKVKEKMLVPKIVDGRNVYDPKAVRNLGFEYVSMGRP